MSFILDNVSYRYSEKTAYEIQALDHVNLKIEDGEFIGIIGHTGSGKSTPTAGLDPKGRDEILDMVSEMHVRYGITVILVSHSMEDVAKYVDRIIVMDHGQVRYDDTPREVFHHYKELEAIGLAAPQVTYLMHEMKERGIDVSTEPTTVEEAKEAILRLIG